MGCAIIFLFVKTENYNIAVVTVSFFKDDKMKKDKSICGNLVLKSKYHDVLRARESSQQICVVK